MENQASAQIAAPARTITEIEQWLVRLLVDTLNLPESRVDVHASFHTYGLDSSALVGFTDALGTWLGRDLDPTLVYDNPNIHKLARAVMADQRSR